MSCRNFELILIKIRFFMNFQNCFKLECVTITEMREDTTTFISLCGFVNSPISVSLFLPLSHAPVKGLYSMCEVCGHGGHMSHLKEWFSANSWCPSGCGHNCVT